MTVIVGHATLWVEGQSRELKPGDTAIVPAGARHRVVNAGDSVAEWLLIAPAGIRFFHENGDEAKPAWSL